MNVIPVNCSRTRTSCQVKADRSLPACPKGVRQVLPTWSNTKELRRSNYVVARIIDCELRPCGGIRRTGYPRGNGVGRTWLQGGHILVNTADSGFRQAVRSAVGMVSIRPGIDFPDRRPW